MNDHFILTEVGRLSPLNRLNARWTQRFQSPSLTFILATIAEGTLGHLTSEQGFQMTLTQQMKMMIDRKRETI